MSGLLRTLLSRCEWVHSSSSLGILFEMGLLQIAFSLVCYLIFGAVRGVIIGVFLYYLFYKIMDFLGYEMVSGIDVMGVLEIHPHLVRNWVSYLKMGKISKEQFLEKYFFTRGIKKFRRLRQILVRKYGFWFFKDVDSELSRKQVKSCSGIHTKQDIHDFMARLCEKDYDYTKPLWEIHVMEDYSEDESVIFIRVNHVLSDGMGIMSLFTFMNDNHNPENITQFREIPFFYNYVMPMLYSPLGLVRFVMAGLKTKSDPNMTPFHLKNGTQSMKKKYFETKYYELSDLRKWYNKFGRMKLNDFMFASISAALSKYFTELGIAEDKQTHFSLSLPVNMKPQPKSIDDVQFKNSCSLVLANVPLSSDINYVMTKNRETFDIGFPLHVLRFGVWVVSCVGLLPEAFARACIRDNSKGLNIIISNTPGPQTPLFFCNQEITDMGGTGPNVGSTGLTLLISSYCGRVKLQMLADDNLNMDPQRLLAHLEKQIDESIQTYALND